MTLAQIAIACLTLAIGPMFACSALVHYLDNRKRRESPISIVRLMNRKQ